MRKIYAPFFFFAGIFFGSHFAGFSQLGPGEMYADPTGYLEAPHRAPAVCIFAEGVPYRASQS